MHRIDRKNLKRLLDRHVAKSAKILDIGCGLGNNLDLLQELGYRDVSGVDISPNMVEATREKGHRACLPEQLEQRDLDVLLFSHVIEHLGYPEIVGFMENYFQHAKPDALIIVITPILYDAFFNDVDHIKPYYPDGLIALFSDSRISKQYRSSFALELIDIHFRRTSLLPYNLRSKYIRSPFNRLFYAALVRAAGVAKWVSLGLLSKATGYAALFRLARQ